MTRTSDHPQKNKASRGKTASNLKPLFFSIARISVHRHIFTCVVITALLLTGSLAAADPQASPGPAGDGASAQPWHLTADSLRYERETNQYVGEGHVIIRRQDRTLSADYVRFNQKNMHAVAEGNVRMTTLTDVISGSRLEMDLNSEVGTIYESTLFIKASHFYLYGDKIEKVGKDMYTASQVSVTTCSGPLPDWKITGKNLNITVEGYGTLTHAALWVRKIPVGYFPYFFFPAKKERQSGFLTPEFGTSKRKGFEYAQPWFWAIDENSDATFYAHYLEKRGLKYGAEYRYIQDEASQGSLMFDFLDDRKTDNGQNDSSATYGYEDDTVTRPNSDRYWFRAKADQNLPNDFNARLDLDIVSDQDYLHDFKRGYAGFEKTNRYFEKEFGRSLDDYDDSIRLNHLNVSRIWSQFSLNAELRWYDDVIKRRQADENPTLQQLPRIEFNAARRQLAQTPFFYSLESEYNYYYRPEIKPLLMRGNRLDAHPRIFLPLKYKNRLSFEPSLGFRETLWYTEGDDIDTSSADFDWENENPFLHREIYDLKLDLSTNLHKIFTPGLFAIDKIKHAVKPQLTYDYVPRLDQDNYPRFESIEENTDGTVITIDDDLSTIDRIEDRNRVTYALTNSFTAKTKKSAPPSATGEPGSTAVAFDYGYRQFAWFKLEQSYIFDESDVDDDKPFSNLLAELEFYPTSHLSMEADARWDPYEDTLASRNIALRLSDAKGDNFYIEHRYSRNLDESQVRIIQGAPGPTIVIADSNTDTFNDSESIYASLQFALTDRVYGYGAYERNLLDDENILTLIGFQYKSQCWSLKSA